MNEAETRAELIDPRCGRQAEASPKESP